jgi:WD40 repeat protein
LAWNVKKYIISGTANGTVHVWSIDSTIPYDKNVSHTKITGTSRVISLLYVESSNVLIVAYEGSSEMKKFDLETLECVCVFKNGHLGNVTCTIIDIQEDNSSDLSESGIRPLNILASGDTLGTVCLWNIDSCEDGIQKPFRYVQYIEISLNVIKSEILFNLLEYLKGINHLLLLSTLMPLR